MRKRHYSTCNISNPVGPFGDVLRQKKSKCHEESVLCLQTSCRPKDMMRRRRLRPFDVDKAGVHKSKIRLDSYSVPMAYKHKVSSFWSTKVACWMKKRLENSNSVVPLRILGVRGALQCIRAALKNPQHHVVFSPQNLLSLMSHVTFNKSCKTTYRCAAHSIPETTVRVKGDQKDTCSPLLLSLLKKK